MSEERKTIPIHLSPRAALILYQFERGSHYGSTNRTVEEIILAYHDFYQTFESLQDVIMEKGTIPNDQFTATLLAMLNTVDRVHKAENDFKT